MYFLQKKKKIRQFRVVSCLVREESRNLWLCECGFVACFSLSVSASLMCFYFVFFCACYEIYLNALNFRGQLPFTDATCWRRRCCRDNGPDSNL